MSVCFVEFRAVAWTWFADAESPNNAHLQAPPRHMTATRYNGDVGYQAEEGE